MDEATLTYLVAGLACWFAAFVWVASRTIAARPMVSVPAFWLILALTQIGPLLGVFYERTTMFVRITSLAEIIAVVVITLWLWRRRVA